MSLRRFVINITAMSSANAARLLAQFFVIPVLSRLLSPTDYGVVGIAMSCIAFALTVADWGMGTSLVRTSGLEWRAWSTCFWLSSFLGVTTAGLMIAFAPAIAVLLGEPALESILKWLALIVVTQSLAAIPGAQLQLTQRFRAVATAEVAPLLSSLAVAVAVGLNGGGPWALVSQQLTFFALRLVLVWSFSSFRPRLAFDLKAVREHIAFGRNVLGTNVLAYLSRSADSLVIGRILGPAVVGFYGMGFQFARLPILLITGPLQYVLYAQLARISDDRPAIRQMLLFLTRALSAMIFPVIGAAAVLHQPIFGLMLSSKWAPSGDLFMLVAPICCLQAVASLGGTAMMAIGRTDVQLRNVAELGLIWATFLLCTVWFGIFWVALAYNCAVLTYLARSCRVILRLLDCPVRLYLQAFIIPVLLTTASTSTLVLLRSLALLGDLSQMAVGTLVAAGAVLSGLFLQRRALIAEMAAIRFSAFMVNVPVRS